MDRLTANTIRERAMAILIDAGWGVDKNATTRRYTVLTHKNVNQLIVLGANGVFRVGRTTDSTLKLTNGPSTVLWARRYAEKAQAPAHNEAQA